MLFRTYNAGKVIPAPEQFQPPEQGDAQPQRLSHCHHSPCGAGQGVGDRHSMAWTQRGESSFVEKCPKLDILVYLFPGPAWPLEINRCQCLRFPTAAPLPE